MTFNQRQTMLLALLISAALLLVNIVIVTSGLGDNLYADIKHWVSSDLS